MRRVRVHKQALIRLRAPKLSNSSEYHFKETSRRLTVTGVQRAEVNLFTDRLVNEDHRDQKT